MVVAVDVAFGHVIAIVALEGTRALNERPKHHQNHRWYISHLPFLCPYSVIPCIISSIRQRYLQPSISSLCCADYLYSKCVASVITLCDRNTVCLHYCSNLSLEKTAPDRGRADCISLTHHLDRDLWHWPSIPCELWSYGLTQKFKVNGQSVLNIHCVSEINAHLWHTVYWVNVQHNHYSFAHLTYLLLLYYLGK